MQKLQFNRIFSLFIFLVAHHTAIYTMHNNTKNFPQQKNHTGGKIIKETGSQDLLNRIRNRCLTELPKQPNTTNKINYNYPMHHDFDLEWTEK